MSDDIIPDGDEWDRPVEYRFTAPLRMIEMLRSGLGQDVSFLSLNHFAILLIIFEMEDERFGIEAQEIHKLAGVEKSTANRIVHSLSDKGRMRDGLGYIRVEHDVNDRRIRRIFLTKKGRFLMEQMATAGTSFDAEEATKLQQAFNANRLASLEKAQEPKKETLTFRKSPEKQTAREMRQESMKSRMALDRKVKSLMRDKANYIAYMGEDALLMSAKLIRRELETGGMFQEHYELTMMDGYWMVFERERLKRGNLHPRAIQQNLAPGAETEAYISQLVDKMNKGFSFADTMAAASKYLNQTEYNRLRTRMTKELATTRDDAMRQITERKRVAHMLAARAQENEGYAVRNRQQAGEKYQVAERMTEQFVSFPVHMTNEKQELVASINQTNQEAREQIELADKLEREAERDALKAEQAAREADELRKQLEANTKAMAEMQAMMKQMLDNK